MRPVTRDSLPHLVAVAIDQLRQRRDTTAARLLCRWWGIELEEGVRFLGLPLLRRLPGSSIRIGSGGIMLPHYSAYKVAEVFAVLANLYPGRVDLGIGRAPGADMATAVALACDGRPKFDAFPATNGATQ